MMIKTGGLDTNVRLILDSFYAPRREADSAVQCSQQSPASPMAARTRQEVAPSSLRPLPTTGFSSCIEPIPLLFAPFGVLPKIMFAEEGSCASSSLIDAIKLTRTPHQGQPDAMPRPKSVLHCRLRGDLVTGMGCGHHFEKFSRGTDSALCFGRSHHPDMGTVNIIVGKEAKSAHVGSVLLLQGKETEPHPRVR